MRWFGGLCLATGASAGLAQPADAAAVVPVSRESTPWWKTRHLEKVAQAATGEARLVLIGDSITHNYELSSAYAPYDFQRVWQRFYAPWRALNLGFNGDTTANALWRLEHGELGTLRPELAIVHIGTNDTIQGASAEGTVQGIAAVIGSLQHHLPDTPVLLVSLLPSKVSALKDARDRQVNALLAQRYRGDGRVTFVDVSPLFLIEGAIDLDCFMDQRADPHAAPLHPDALAQERMAERLDTFVQRRLRRR